MRVAIIGAGILGANLAYALSRRGADVTVIEAAGPAAAATGHSFGWVNASFYADAAHFALRAEGIAGYRRLCKDLDLPVAWSGCLCWEQEGDALTAQAAALVALGYEAQIVSRKDMAYMEPNVAVPERAIFFRSEAAVEPAALTRALLAASGARVLMGSRVAGMALQNGCVTGVCIPGGTLPVDRVIVASGIGSADLLAPLGVHLPMLHRPGVIFHTQSLPPMLSHVCVAPIGEFRQLPDGRILMPTAISHQADQSEQIADRLDILADAALARLQKLLPGIALTWQDVSLAQRPVPQDGLPVIGACGPEGLYAAVMHSGITLAPVVAEMLAADVMGQMSAAQAALVAPYAPVRFQQGV